MEPPVESVDVAIIGGGMVGASLAEMLAPLGLAVALIEAQPIESAAQPSFDARTTALSNGTRRILETMGLWDSLAAAATPIRSIHISERGRFGRAVIDAREQGLPAMGYVLPNRALGHELWRRLRGRAGIRVLSPAGGGIATNAIAIELGVTHEQAEVLKCATDLKVPVPVLVPVAESSVFGAAFASPAVEARGQDSQVVSEANAWASSVVSEIRNSLDYYLSGEHATAIADVCCVGRAASMPGLVERIATELPYPISAADPWMGLTGRRRRNTQPPDARLALAIGLATARTP